jgi:hypothetical protein
MLELLINETGFPSGKIKQNIVCKFNFASLGDFRLYVVTLLKGRERERHQIFRMDGF